MVSEEYLKQLISLIDLSDSTNSEFINKIRNLKKEEKIIIYGAGGGGTWLLDLLSKYSVNVNCFFDSDSEKWNESIDGMPIHDPQRKNTEDSNSLIIIALRNIQAQQEVLEKLRILGYTNVILYSKIWNNFFNNPDIKIKNMFDTQALIKAAKIWNDQKSLDLFMDIIKFHTIFDYEMNNTKECEVQYFPDDIPLKNDFSCFIDCGAYTGDTIMEIQKKSLKPKEIIAFEPDTGNFLKLSKFLKENSSCGQYLLYPCGVWSETTQMGFSDGNDASSSITSGGERKQFVALDEILFNINPTFIKMDVEGAEVEALQGGKELIRINKPDLAICLYHKISHLWEIVLLIDSWKLGYDFYIRQHDYTMEIVMYATIKNS